MDGSPFSKGHGSRCSTGSVFRWVVGSLALWVLGSAAVSLFSNASGFATDSPSAETGEPFQSSSLLSPALRQKVANAEEVAAARREADVARARLREWQNTNEAAGQRIEAAETAEATAKAEAREAVSRLRDMEAKAEALAQEIQQLRHQKADFDLGALPASRSQGTFSARDAQVLQGPGGNASTLAIIGISSPWRDRLKLWMEAKLGGYGEHAMVSFFDRKTVQLDVLESMATVDREIFKDRAWKRDDRFSDTPMDDFRIACTFSHRRALQYFLESGHNYGLVLEDDVTVSEEAVMRYGDGDLKSAISSIINAMWQVDRNWSFINLGRCWDMCSKDEVVDKQSGFVKSWFPMCTQAYLVSPRGAKTLLAYSLPIVTTIDQLISLLGRDRTDDFRIYSTDPRLLVQAVVEGSHQYDAKSDKPACTTLNVEHNIEYDISYLDRIRQSRFRPFLVGYKTALGVEPNVSNVTDPTGRVPRFCSLYTPTSKNSSSPIFQDPHTQKILEYMQKHDLKGFLVWDFRNKKHTHRFMHEAFYHVFKRIAETAHIPLHACWINPIQYGRVSLRRFFGYSKYNARGLVRGRLASSLVIASPKHMPWSRDPGILNLDYDPTSKYVFHDFVPAHFKPIQERGDAIQWVVWGPDGNYPWFDNIDFTLRARMPWFDNRSSLPGIRPLDETKCSGFICKLYDERIYISPWATPLLPDEIQEDRGVDRLKLLLRRSGKKNASELSKKDIVMNFVGSIWEGNKKEMEQFLLGCTKAKVHMYGLNVPVLDSWQQLKDMGTFEYFGKLIDSREYIAWLKSAEIFLPAVQGPRHIAGNYSYIADRAITLAAVGQLTGTNNPAVVEFFKDFRDAIIFNSTGSLCDAYVDGLQDFARRQEAVKRLIKHVREKHTYIARFKDLLEFF